MWISRGIRKATLRKSPFTQQLGPKSEDTWSASKLRLLALQLQLPAGIISLVKESSENVRCEAIAALANLAVNGARSLRAPTYADRLHSIQHAPS